MDIALTAIFCGKWRMPVTAAQNPLPQHPGNARRPANFHIHFQPKVRCIMSDEDNIITDLGLEGPAMNGADTAPAAGIISQYVKDLSVENPNSPDSFSWTDAPQIDVQFNIGARQLSDEVSEIELKIALKSIWR